MRFLVGALILVLAAPAFALDFFSSQKEDSSPSAADGTSLEQRVQMLERRINTISNIVLRLDSLQQEMQQLRGDVELQNHEMENLKKRQTDLYNDMDLRISRLTGEAPAGMPADAAGGMEPAATATTGEALQGQTQTPEPSSEPNWESSPVPSASNQPSRSMQGQQQMAPTVAPHRPAESNLPPVVSSSNPSAQTASPNQSADAVSPGQLQTTSVVMAQPQSSYQEAEGEKSSYQQAFNLLMDRKYDQAQQGFRNFLAKYPRSRLADNAQYWLAESNYVTRNFDVALTEFNKVIQAHPNSAKVSDALLKVGYIQYEQKQWSAAKETLNTVMNRYPNTTASQLAEKRLRQMRTLGR